MIPNNAFTTVPVVSAFVPPHDRPYSALQDVVLGGTAIGSGAAGRNVQNWVASYDGSTITVRPENAAVQFSLAMPGVLTLSLAFDANMSVVLAWRTATTSNLYFYSGVTSSYQTQTFGGQTSCRVCVDETRSFASGASDVIFAYTAGGTLYYRQQRDNYAIEYTVGPVGTKRLRQVALTVGSRLQFELR